MRLMNPDDMADRIDLTNYRVQSVKELGGRSDAVAEIIVHGVDDLDALHQMAVAVRGCEPEIHTEWLEHDDSGHALIMIYSEG